MGKKKRVKKTMPMRVLDGKGISYQVHQHAHKQEGQCHGNLGLARPVAFHGQALAVG